MPISNERSPQAEGEAAPSPTPRYRAFISYRHAGVDSKVAAAVQRGLERFRIPKAFRGVDGSAYIAPVFRDKEELPVSARLGDDIEAALHGADSLIVVCSPRTHESMWVAREIDLFLSSHPRDRVFVVLAEGEPADVIPEVLLHETRTVTLADGTEREELLDVEPLACDFREQARKDRHTEITRLAAALLGVRFDVLMRRAQRRRMRIVASIAAAITVMALGIAGYALWSDARIKKSYRETLQQQSQYLTTAAQEALDEGDRLSAIELASAALPAAGEDRPLYPDAVRTLADATLAYSDGYAAREWSTAGLAAKYYMSGKICAMATSEDGRLLAALDDKGTLRAWDLQTDELLFEAAVSDASSTSTLAITDDGLLVMACSGLDTGQMTCYDITQSEPLWYQNFAQEIEDDDYWAYNSDCKILLADQETAIALTDRAAYLVDLRSGEVRERVRYDVEDPYHLSPWRVSGGWNPTTAQLVIGGGECGYELDEQGAETGEWHWEPMGQLIDFAAGTATRLAGIDSHLNSVCFLDDATVLLSSASGEGATMSNYYYTDAFNQVTQTAYAHRVSCVDLRSGAVRWSETTQAWLPPDFDSISYLGTEVEGYADCRVVACCFANLCCLRDADTGALLERFDLPASIRLAWPGPSYDSDRVLDGMLTDGSSFAVFVNEGFGSLGGGKTLSNPGQYPDLRFESSSGVARLSQGLLIRRSNLIYRYADTIEVGEGTVVESSSWNLEDVYSTAYGWLVVDQQRDDDTSMSKRRYALLDSTNGGVAWMHVTDDSEHWSLPEVIGDPTGRDHLVLYRICTDGESSNQILVIDLADGSLSYFEATGTTYFDEEEFEELRDSCVLDSSLHDGCASSDHAFTMVKVSTVRTSVAHPDGSTTTRRKQDTYISMTDLLTGESTLTPLSELGLGEYDSGWDGETWVLGPMGTMIVATLEEVIDEDCKAKPSVACGIIDVEARTTIRLPLKLRPYVYGDRYGSPGCVVWSQDGRQFVGTTLDEVVVFDTNGREVFSVPLRGRELLSVFLTEGKLLAVWLEDANVYLASYVFANGGLPTIGDVPSVEDVPTIDDVMTMLDGTAEAGLAGTCRLSYISGEYVSPEYFTWSVATEAERDPGSICLHYGILGSGTLYLVSIEPFGVCQVVEDCVGYDDETRLFLTCEWTGAEYVYATYPRYTLDELLARGEEQVGASAMTSVERQAYGLEVGT